MKTIYKIELMAAFTGILLTFLFSFPLNNFKITGYVLGVNQTAYIEEMDLFVDGSQSYVLATEKILNLKSFMLSGEVLGDGRVEILLDNGKGEQYLVYENIEETPEMPEGGFPITGITGRAITSKALAEEDNEVEKQVAWIVVQPKKDVIEYEFTPLKENQEIIHGEFFSECSETCKIQENVFNSQSYSLIFRLEKGTSVKITRMRYTLYEEQ
jgi:hypothetical protein